MKSYVQTILFLFASVALANPVLATDLFVSPNGNDLNNGTSNNPFKTIQQAIDKAKAGDTITLAPGTYRQDFVTRTDGTAILVPLFLCH